MVIVGAVTDSEHALADLRNRRMDGVAFEWSSEVPTDPTRGGEHGNERCRQAPRPLRV
jgi:hypothetical protein